MIFLKDRTFFSSWLLLASLLKERQVLFSLLSLSLSLPYGTNLEKGWFRYEMPESILCFLFFLPPLLS